MRTVLSKALILLLTLCLLLSPLLGAPAARLSFFFRLSSPRRNGEKGLYFARNLL